MLIVRKTGDGANDAGDKSSPSGSIVPVEICADPRRMPPDAWPLRADAKLTRLVGTNGRDTSATRGELTLAGRTLSGSLDGAWMGDEVVEMVQPRDGPAGQVCYDVDMGSYSAALLTLETNA